MLQLKKIKSGSILPRIDFGGDENQRKLELIERGGTIIVVDFPKINHNSLLWKKFSECKKLKSFYDKGQEVGFII